MQSLKAINLLLLGALVGVELFLGIVVAKAIFYAPLANAAWSEAGLEMFDRGALMTRIFVALGWMMVAVSVVNLGFELINLRAKFSKNAKLTKICLAVLNLALSLLFCFYYTREIALSVEAISQGLASVELFASEDFRAFHAQSERLVKVLVVFQAILFLVNFRMENAAAEKNKA